MEPFDETKNNLFPLDPYKVVLTCTESSAMRISSPHMKSNVNCGCQLYCHRVKADNFFFPSE